MTIAAGFHCKDGILLCADTKTTGVGKIQDTKILKANFGKENPATSAVVLVAIAGAVRYARMGAKDCFSIISKGEPAERCLQSIVNDFRTGLRTLHEKDLYQHPEFKTGELRVQYLIAIRAKDGFGLFTASDTAVESVDYDCIGSGAYLGHHLVRPIRGDIREMDMTESALWATHILMQVKEHDEHCGGYSEMQSLGADGSVSRTSYFEISFREKYLERFDRATRRLFGHITKTSQPEFLNAITRFQTDMLKVKEAWEERRDEYEEMFRVLTKRIN